MTKDLQGSSHHLKVVGGAYGKRLAVVVRPEMCSDIAGRCDQLQAESVFRSIAICTLAGWQNQSFSYFSILHCSQISNSDYAAQRIFIVILDH